MLRIDDLTKDYQTPAGPLRVLSGVSLSLSRGDAVSIMGPSGSGKSTLLHILGTLDRPTSGRVALDDVDPFALDERALARFRNTAIGFVFQDHHLLPQCSVLENVLVPTLPAGTTRDDESRARMLLDEVGLSPRVTHVPAQLSGGEKQRVAIARALIRQPALVLCDEPTGNLDRVSAEAVAGLLFDLHARQNTMLVVVTHSEALAARCPQRFELREARLRAA